MRDEDDWHDEDAEAVAFHEAGHAVAAVLCAVGWKEARLVESEAEQLEEDAVAWVEYVQEHHDDTTPANRAFIAWAGPWAEARYHEPDDPWRALPEAQTYGGADDMDRVYAYWNDPAHAPHETEEQWARDLDFGWRQVERLAARLIREGTVRTPLHPDRRATRGDLDES